MCGVFVLSFKSILNAQDPAQRRASFHEGSWPCFCPKVGLPTKNEFAVERRSKRSPANTFFVGRKATSAAVLSVLGRFPERTRSASRVQRQHVGAVRHCALLPNAGAAPRPRSSSGLTRRVPSGVVRHCGSDARVLHLSQWARQPRSAGAYAESWHCRFSQRGEINALQCGYPQPQSVGGGLPILHHRAESRGGDGAG